MRWKPLACCAVIFLASIFLEVQGSRVTGTTRLRSLDEVGLPDVLRGLGWAVAVWVFVALIRASAQRAEGTKEQVARKDRAP